MLPSIVTIEYKRCQLYITIGVYQSINKMMMITCSLVFLFSTCYSYMQERVCGANIHTYIEILKNNRENIENCLLLLLINKLIIIIIIISNINYVVVTCLTND